MDLPRINWKDRFKQGIYKKCFPKIPKNKVFCSKQNQIIQNILKKRGNRIHFDKSVDHIAPKVEDSCHAYIPIRRNVEIDDQLVNTFPYIKDLFQNENLTEQSSIYQAIISFMQKCLKQKRTEDGWEVILNQFLCNLDFLKKVELYIEALKYGTSEIKSYHKKKNVSCLKNVLYWEIIKMGKFLREEISINRALKVSIYIHDEINIMTMSKTMKMLYCCICFKYDCGKHKLEEVPGKNYHYVALKNAIPSSEHIRKAMIILSAHKSKLFDENKKCSKSCYKHLPSQNIKEIEEIKMRLLSPMVCGVIQIGIEMFSFDPCKISFLFPKGEKYKQNIVTCSIIYLFLIQEYNLLQKLSRKLFKNQNQFLLKEPKIYPPSKPIFKRKKKKNQIDKNNGENISICIHSYIGEDIFDNQCQNCVCTERGFCLPQCLCSENCDIMVKGCSCRNRDDCMSDKCSCYNERRECIPEVCFYCFHPKQHEEKRCRNHQIMRDESKIVRIGKSTIPNAGLGGYAGEPILKGDLVGLYCGQMLQTEVESIRQLIKRNSSFYNFEIGDKTIDARYFGNRARFINHANEVQEKANLISLNIYSEGQNYIALYACRDIEEGEELFFDYDFEENMGKNLLLKYPFLKKQK